MRSFTRRAFSSNRHEVCPLSLINSPSLFQINSKSSYREVEPKQIAVRQSRFKTQPELWQAGNFYADYIASKFFSVYTVE